MAFYCIHCRSEIDPKYKACPFCGEAITDFLRQYLETPIDGKYKILSRLGVGGMGEVYKVLHIHLNAIRVIKLMRPAIADDRGAHDRFLREARMATKINQSNVASLFDFSTLSDGSWYMVWEYIEGTNLHELLEEKGPLSPKYAAMLAVQALRGLDAIHRAGIVHRDVSPENLMITRDSSGEERVKVIDLGIAKQWGEEADEKTKTGMFVGKWKYCSPEHLGMLPQGERIDGRADLYSFGIVLYEMLTGVAPFQSETPHGYVMLHASEKPRPLREVNPTVKASPELEELILKAMEKDRARRFPTARDFADALEHLAPGLDATAGEPPPLPIASEVTAEPTRAARIDGDAPTVVSLAETQPATVVAAAAGVGAATVVTVPPVAARKRTPAMLAIAVVLVLVIGGVTAMMLWRSSQTPVAEVTKASVPAPAVAARGRVAINAFPWASITGIRNLESGEAVSIDAGLVTPAPVDLHAGRYEITLSNPSFRRTLTEVVDVQAGRDATVNVQFTDASLAELPSFGGVKR